MSALTACDRVQDTQNNLIDLMEIKPIAISAGAGSSFAIDAEGNLWAWGLNNRSQLGDGTSEERLNPVMVLDNVMAVSAGIADEMTPKDLLFVHTLAIREDGSLWGWGSNGAGQIGDGTTETRNTPVHIMDNVADITESFNGIMIALQTNGTLWSCAY